MAKSPKRTCRWRVAAAAAAVLVMGAPSVARADSGQPGGDYGDMLSWLQDWFPLVPVPAPSSPHAPVAVRPPAAGSAHVSRAAARTLDLVNEERAQAGCAPLVIDPRLTEAARTHSREMAVHRFMSHDGFDGSTPTSRMARTGYRAAASGENVAFGYHSPESVVRAWMASPGHRRNILDCSYRATGIGRAEPGDYWTQNFGSSR